MQEKIKKLGKRFLGFIFTVLLVAFCFAECMPVSAAPNYMVKLEGDGLNYGWVYQTVTGLDASKTYVFRCDYYAELDGECTVAAWHEDTELNKYATKMKSGRKGSVELKCQPDENGKLKVRFDVSPNAYSFAWNVSLKEQGANKELLTNADFKSGNGSLEGWGYGKTMAAVIPYDESFFETKVISGNKTYMAKLKGDGEGYGWLYQRLSGLDANKTYVFSCDYFATLQGGSTIAAWHVDSDANKYTASMQINQQGNLKLKCQPDKNGNLNVRFDVGPNALSYVWNVSLKEEGSNNELLLNSDFKLRKGSFAGWNNSANKAQVIEYDSSLFKVEKDSDDGNYMAKLEGDGKNYGWLYQRLKELDANTTYVFSCDYYATAAGGSTMVAWHVDSDSAKYTARMNVGKEGKLELECKPDADGNLNVRFDVGPNVLCYVWNISLRAKGTDKNLLTNANFQKGMGSFAGWSNTAKKCEVLRYDSSLFQISTNIGTGDYMAKLEGDGKTYGWLYQRLSGLNPKKTYVFKCNYFNGLAGGSTMAAWYKDSDSSKYTARMKGGKAGELVIKCKPDAKGNLNVRFDVGPNVLCYVWNVSLKAEGSDEELLVNADFRIGEGTLIGWSNGTTKCTVVPYNKALFTLNMDKDNRDYMLKLDGPDSGWSWFFQRLDDLDPNRTYVFSFDYCMGDTGATAAAWWNDNESLKYSTSMRANMAGTIKLECKPDPEGRLNVRFDIGAAVEAYVWNISLKAKGSNTERLVNADFRIGKGSLYGWDRGKTNSEVLVYDSGLINSLIEKNKSLKDYENPNLAFHFEDAEKYKAIDLVKFAGDVASTANDNDTTDVNEKVEIQKKLSPVVWVSFAVLLLFNASLVAVKITQRTKKEKKEK